MRCICLNSFHLVGHFPQLLLKSADVSSSLAQWLLFINGNHLCDFIHGLHNDLCLGGFLSEGLSLLLTIH